LLWYAVKHISEILEITLFGCAESVPPNELTISAWAIGWLGLRQWVFVDGTGAGPHHHPTAEKRRWRSASGERSLGIGQLREASSQLDRATHQNTARSNRAPPPASLKT
jgi:hypothetical protein